MPNSLRKSTWLGHIEAVSRHQTPNKLASAGSAGTPFQPTRESAAGGGAGSLGDTALPVQAIGAQPDSEVFADDSHAAEQRSTHSSEYDYTPPKGVHAGESAHVCSQCSAQAQHITHSRVCQGPGLALMAILSMSALQARQRGRAPCALRSTRTVTSCGCSPATIGALSARTGRPAHGAWNGASRAGRDIHYLCLRVCFQLVHAGFT